MSHAPWVSRPAPRAPECRERNEAGLALRAPPDVAKRRRAVAGRGAPCSCEGVLLPSSRCFSRARERPLDPSRSVQMGRCPDGSMKLTLLVPRSKSFRRSSLASTRNLTQAETAVLESLARPSSQWWGTSDTGEDLPRWCAHLSTRTFDKYETKSYSAPTRGWRIAGHRISSPRTPHERRLTR